METKLFNNITKEEQQDILVCSGARERTYKNGQYIFRLGDDPHCMYVIKSGDVMIARDFASGKRNVLFTVHPGDVFGEPFSFTEEKKCWSDAIAVGSVSVVEIPWSFFSGFCNNACKKHQQIVRNMLEILSDKNFKITRKLYLLSGKTIRERIAMWLLVGAHGKDSFTSCMNKEELADFLGTTRPSLSREMLLMQSEGLFSSEKRTYTILDKKTLEELAEL